MPVRTGRHYKLAISTLARERARAKEHFGLAALTPVVSCYEATAGRGGHSHVSRQLHRLSGVPQRYQRVVRCKRGLGPVCARRSRERLFLEQ